MKYGHLFVWDNAPLAPCFFAYLNSVGEPLFIKAKLACVPLLQFSFKWCTLALLIFSQLCLLWALLSWRGQFIHLLIYLFVCWPHEREDGFSVGFLVDYIQPPSGHLSQIKNKFSKTQRHIEWNDKWWVITSQEEGEKFIYCWLHFVPLIKAPFISVILCFIFESGCWPNLQRTRSEWCGYRGQRSKCTVLKRSEKCFKGDWLWEKRKQTKVVTWCPLELIYVKMCRMSEKSINHLKI